MPNIDETFSPGLYVRHVSHVARMIKGKGKLDEQKQKRALNFSISCGVGTY
jgi:hypothetical protein